MFMLDDILKVLAFYFPQYHPFPENDKFWGKGFTEWNNVVKARPLFEGHNQPNLPGELGFYDLRVKDVMRRQMELAKNHGIYGFCLHHYWFSGKPVMRVPYNNILSDQSLDLPFCLHWANEPWTVRWDGCLGKGVLLEQKHTPEDDIAFIKDIEPALKDKRYIRIDGRPLLIVYRPSLFFDMKSTIKRWNDYCVGVGIGKLYLAMMQTCFDEITNPAHYDCDAAIEYPPHNFHLEKINDKIRFFDDFKGNVFDYAQFRDFALSKEKPDYTLFRGVVPSWDCTPRRKTPDIFANSSPALYQKWLSSMCEYTIKNNKKNERLVFINAWNEWGEGAYLEPDMRYGYANLNATERAINDL